MGQGEPSQPENVPPRPTRFSSPFPTIISSLSFVCISSPKGREARCETASGLLSKVPSLSASPSSPSLFPPSLLPDLSPPPSPALPPSLLPPSSSLNSLQSLRPSLPPCTSLPLAILLYLTPSPSLPPSLPAPITLPHSSTHYLERPLAYFGVDSCGPRGERGEGEVFHLREQSRDRVGQDGRGGERQRHQQCSLHLCARDGGDGMGGGRE